MSRLWTCTGVCLLLLSSYGSIVWCYEDTAPYTVRRPLDTLFRAGSLPQTHVGPVPALGLNGSGSHAAHDSHGSLANDQQHQAQRQLSISGAFQPLEQHRRVEPGGSTGNHHRWHADQRPDVFGVGTVPAFQRALPAIDIGSPGSDDDFIGHGGQPSHEMFEPSVPDSPLDPTDNEIGDNPLLAALGAISGPRVVDHEEIPNQPTGRMMESIDLIREQLERIKQEEDIEIKSNLLMKLLTELPEGPLPIVYIEDAAGKAGSARRVTEADEDDTVDDGASEDNEEDGDDGQLAGVGGRIRTEPFTPNGGKRSGRYYRRYPWKRQNARSRT
uniref:Secreted protein n=1 Tax=Anopheles culicifacies TaxID=139723 RepID=A0A182MJR6_9DIPT